MSMKVNWGQAKRRLERFSIGRTSATEGRRSIGRLRNFMILCGDRVLRGGCFGSGVLEEMESGRLKNLYAQVLVTRGALCQM